MLVAMGKGKGGSRGSGTLRGEWGGWAFVGEMGMWGWSLHLLAAARRDHPSPPSLEKHFPDEKVKHLGLGHQHMDNIPWTQGEARSLASRDVCRGWGKGCSVPL